MVCIRRGSGGSTGEAADAIAMHVSHSHHSLPFLDGLAAQSRSELPNVKAEPGIALSRFTGVARPK